MYTFRIEIMEPMEILQNVCFVIHLSVVGKSILFSSIKMTRNIVLHLFHLEIIFCTIVCIYYTCKRIVV